MSLFFGIYFVCNEVDSTVLLGSLYGRTLTEEFYKKLCLASGQFQERMCPKYNIVRRNWTTTMLRKKRKEKQLWVSKKKKISQSHLDEKILETVMMTNRSETNWHLYSQIKMSLQKQKVCLSFLVSYWGQWKMVWGIYLCILTLSLSKKIFTLVLEVAYEMDVRYFEATVVKYVIRIGYLFCCRLIPQSHINIAFQWGR